MIGNITKYYPDSLYTTCQKDAAGILVNIINTTTDSVYVFNSYLDKELLSSKYLHRIDIKGKKYKLSLLPLIPFLFTKRSDVITDGPLIGHQQIVYDFFKLVPNSTQNVILAYSDMFKNKDQRNNVSKDYDVKLLHKYSKQVRQDFVTVNYLPKGYSFAIEFAAYKSVDLLGTESAYFLKENDFDKQSKEFQVLEVPVDIKGVVGRF